MRTRTIIAITIALAIVSTVFIAAGRHVSATQIEFPNGQKLRFRLIGDEPIAGPDGQSIVPGWKVLVFEDRKSARCYVTFTHDSAAAAAADMPCAELIPAR
jgi:hypothetical protein